MISQTTRVYLRKDIYDELSKDTRVQALDTSTQKTIVDNVFKVLLSAGIGAAEHAINHELAELVVTPSDVQELNEYLTRMNTDDMLTIREDTDEETKTKQKLPPKKKPTKNG